MFSAHSLLLLIILGFAPPFLSRAQAPPMEQRQIISPELISRLDSWRVKLDDFLYGTSGSLRVGSRHNYADWYEKMKNRSQDMLQGRTVEQAKSLGREIVSENKEPLEDVWVRIKEDAAWLWQKFKEITWNTLKFMMRKAVSS